MYSLINDNEVYLQVSVYKIRKRREQPVANVPNIGQIRLKQTTITTHLANN
jgi:hypothetical protein